MQTKITVLATLCLASLVSIGWQDTNRPDVIDGTGIPAAVDGLQLLASTDKEEYSPLEPVVVHLVFTNVSQETKMIAFAGPSVVFKVKCFDENGVEVPLTRFGTNVEKYGRSAQFKPISLPPGCVIRTDITVSRWFDMSTDGIYYLTFARLVRCEPAHDQSIRATSNRVKICINNKSGQRW